MDEDVVAADDAIDYETVPGQRTDDSIAADNWQASARHIRWLR
jgi:hypothetical protein